jgi:alkylation response protein AidB-like acyl-CoA dehydrogenase
MPTYTPPLRDMQFVLHELLDVPAELRLLPRHAEVDADTINAVLDGAGQFAAEVLAPLNAPGDREGCQHDKATHEVRTPAGFKAAYAQYVEGGWPSLTADPEYGGQGLPIVLNQCLFEMLNSANQSWTMYPGLSHGAYEALHAHGTPEQKAQYLPKLTSGHWTGTMCLTEPHCGTDLGLLRSKAEPQADGSYKITGQKIFISAGEHDLADNIVHLVLARAAKASRCSWCRSSWSSLTARSANATRSSAAPSNTRWASTATRPARSTWTVRTAPWSARRTRAWPRCS